MSAAAKAKPFCECLAAWVDSEPCICGEPIGAPMEVSAKKLDEAQRLVRDIQAMDRALKKLAKDKPYCRTMVDVHGSYGPNLELRLPPDIAAGLIRTMRFHATVKLAETGVTSMATGYRPVVSA